MPGDLHTRLLLGENRYRANRYREAAQHLTAVAEHPDAERLPEEAGEAAYHAALAELKMRRPEKAQPLLEAAVRLHPQPRRRRWACWPSAPSRTARSSGARSARAAGGGDASTPAERALALRAAGRRDPVGAEGRAAGDGGVRARAAGDAVSTDAARQAAVAGARRRRHRAAALTGGAAGGARRRRRSSARGGCAKRPRSTPRWARPTGGGAAARALELDPLAHEAPAGLSALLVARGRDDEAAQLLTRALPLLPPPPAGRARGAGDAVDAPRRMPRSAARRRAARSPRSRRRWRPIRRAGRCARRCSTLRRRSGARRRGARPPLRSLADEPLHAPSLRAMARIDGRTGSRDAGPPLSGAAGGGRRAQRRRAPAAGAVPPPTSRRAKGALDEADHACWRTPTRCRWPVFAALWEGSAPLTRRHGLTRSASRPTIASRRWPRSELARAYSTASRILGNRKTGLYLKAARRARRGGGGASADGNHRLAAAGATGARRPTCASSSGARWRSRGRSTCWRRR